MINIVQALFGKDGHRGNTVRRIGTMPPLLLSAWMLVALASTAEAAAPGGVLSSRGEAGFAAPVVVRCDPYRDPYSTDCPGHRPPGPRDRDVRPFDGTLGRPCAYRWRFSPQGTRRVRVCF